MTNERFFNATAMFALFSITLTVVTALGIIYMTVLEKPYLSYTNMPIPLMIREVHAGDVLPLRVARCNTSKEQKLYSSARLLKNMGADQEVIVLETVGVVVQPGCNETITLINRVPEATPPGQYRIEGISTVAGLIRNFLIPWHTETFRVVPKTPPPLPQPMRGPPGPPGPPGAKGAPGKPAVPLATDKGQYK